jgi:hypothetical protein
MSDYSESGARPVDDAAVEDPPTEEEVRKAQEANHPGQAATRLEGTPGVDPDDDGLSRRPDDGALPSDTDVQAERQAEGEAGEDAAAERASQAAD